MKVPFPGPRLYDGLQNVLGLRQRDLSHCESRDRPQFNPDDFAGILIFGAMCCYRMEWIETEVSGSKHLAEL